MSVYSQVSSYSDYVDLQHYTGSAGNTGAGPTMSGSIWLSGSTLNDTTFYFNSGIETAGSITGETSLTIGDVTLAEAELAFLDGITAGTALASKALILDSNKIITGITQLTASEMSASGRIQCTDLIVHDSSIQIGSTTLNETEMGFIDGITAGTALASKALVLDSSKNIATVGTVGCGAITSTGASTFVTVSGSGQLSGMKLVVDTGGTIGLAADTDLLTLTANTLTVAGTVNASTAMSASTTVKGRSFTADTGGTIGCAADTDLMTLTANTLTVAGAANATTVSGSGAVSGGSFAAGTTITGSGQLSGMKLVVDTGGTIGCAADTDLLTLANGALTVAGTLQCNTSLTIGSAVMSEADFEFLDDLTAGTAVASKALVVDSNKDIGTIRNLTIDGTFSDGNYTFDTSGNVTSLGTVGCGAVTSTGAVQGTSLTASAAISGRSLTIDTGKTIGCAADTDLLTLTANTLTVAGTANIGTAMSASTTLSGRSLTVDTGLTIGCAADTDLMTLTANTLTVAGTVNASTAMSASTTVKGRSLTIDTGKTIGCAADTDLMTLAANTLTVAGAVNSTTLSGSGAVSGGPGAFGTTVTAGTTMSASQGISGRSLTVDTGLTIGCAADTDLLTLSNGNVTFTGTTVIATADVNGGAIDAVTIGTNSAATRLVVQGAGAQSVKSTGANHITLSAGQGESANAAANLIFNAANNMTFDAQGTNEDDGFSFTLGTDTDDVIFDIRNNSAHSLGMYDGSGMFEHNSTNKTAADFILNGNTSDDSVTYDAGENALIVYDGGSETMRFGGDATSDYALDIKDGSNAINKVRAAAFVTYSDERLKTDIDEMQGALKTVNSLKAVNFTWAKDGKRDFGFLAQDLKKVIPQAVHGNDDGLLGVDYGRLTSVLVRAIQEQSVQIKALQEKLDK